MMTIFLSDRFPQIEGKSHNCLQHGVHLRDLCPYLMVMEEYHVSGKDIWGNTVWDLRDWPPISKDEDGIPQYVWTSYGIYIIIK